MFTRLCLSFAAVLLLVIAVVGQDRESEGRPQPTLVSAPTPFYPKDARDAGIGGRVTVRVVVDESGAIVSVNHASGPAKLCGSGNNDSRLVALRNSMIESIKAAKFEAAIKNGKPVKSVAFVSSTFDPFEGKPGALGRKLISGGVLNGTALELPRPEYPGEARAARAGGTVSVQVVIDEAGKVFTAEALSGHSLLRHSAITAACNAKFSPTELDGKQIRVSGIVTYNFVPR